MVSMAVEKARRQAEAELVSLKGALRLRAERRAAQQQEEHARNEEAAEPQLQHPEVHQ